jgi:hypothetical protein
VAEALGSLSSALEAPAAKPDLAPAPQRTPWWKPSFADLFLIAFILWSFAVSADGWKGLLLDGDCGWHIRTGEYILQTGIIPSTDIFSFTKYGKPWFAWEWLTDILWAGLHHTFGLRGLAWFAGAIIAVFTTTLLRFALWRGANVFVALGVTLAASGAASIHYLARPHLFTLLVIPVFMWVIDRDRKQQSKWLWALVPLTAVWTNLHGGWVISVLITGALAAGSLIEKLLGREDASWALVRRYGLLTALCALASLANPFGVHLHLHIVGYLKSDWIRNMVKEFQSPQFRSESLLQFEVLMFVGFLAAARHLRERRITEVLWFLGLAHMALEAARHVPVYVAVLAPWIAVEITRWWNYWVGRADRKSAAAIFDQMSRDIRPVFTRNSVWAPAALVVILMLPAPLMKWPTDFPDFLFPTKFVQQFRSEIAGSRVLTTDQWADYLIYANYPQQRVFFDGRSDFYGPEIGDDCLRLANASHQWPQLLDQYRFDWALVPVEWPLAAVLKLDRRWRIRGDDGKAIVFERVKGAGER